MDRSDSHFSFLHFSLHLFLVFFFFALSLATRRRDDKCYWTVIIKLTKKNSHPPTLLSHLFFFTSQFRKIRWQMTSSIKISQRTKNRLHFPSPLPPPPSPNPHIWFVQLIKRGNLLVFSVASYQHSLISILLKFYKDINIEGYNTVKNTKWSR